MNIEMGGYSSVLIVVLALLYFTVVVRLSYYLGQRKTETPTICAVVGFGLAFVPPFLLIYLALLVLKPDIKTQLQDLR